MAKAVKLGRIWTVPIQGTYSLAILILLVAAVTGWQMRYVVDGYGFAAYALAGLGSAILFVWTVFAHETAHVVAARHFGARVKGVTLSFVGGEAAISGQPGSPWQGIAVAASGPIASLLCGGGCLGLAFLAASFSAPTLVSISLAWVGVLCLLLGIANMLPAAPLDGGHILQAAVWATTGNRTRASAVAGLAGQVLGVGLLFWGFWFILHDGAVVQALAAAVVGWPVWRGASATVRVARQRERLGGLTVAGALKPDPITVRADAPLAEVGGQLRGHDGLVAVVDASGGPVAVVKAAVLARAATRDSTRPVRDAVRRGRRKLIKATVEEPLADVLERCYGEPRPAAVVEGGRLTGILEPEVVQATLEAAPVAAVSSGHVVVDTWPGVGAAPH
jgi:Zn-dependent protease/CBS domain-containing protein